MVDKYDPCSICEALAEGEPRERLDKQCVCCFYADKGAYIKDRDARIAALEAQLAERKAECERLRSKLEQRDYEIASMLKRQANE